LAKELSIELFNVVTIACVILVVFISFIVHRVIWILASVKLLFSEFIIVNPVEVLPGSMPIINVATYRSSSELMSMQEATALLMFCILVVKFFTEFMPASLYSYHSIFS